MWQKASNSQLRMIYGLAKRLGIDNDVLHDIAARLCRCESLAKLSIVDARRIIDYLKRQAGEAVREPVDRASSAQQNRICALVREKIGRAHV